MPRPSESRVVHLELHTPNAAGACAFYRRLFGWPAQTVHIGPASYISLSLGGLVDGGAVEEDAARASWLPYVAVPDAADAAARAEVLGAEVVLEPREGPAGSRAIIAAPDRARIGLWQPKERGGPALDHVVLRPVGVVESPLVARADAPKQGGEGAPDAWLVFDDAYLPAVADLRPGQRVVVLTWLDRADRDTLRVHPRDDPANPERGVFSTRSGDRPNPIGLHDVEILAVDGARVRAGPLEALDGTPVLDVKPAFWV